MCPSWILIAQIFDRCPLNDIEKENKLKQNEDNEKYAFCWLQFYLVLTKFKNKRKDNNSPHKWMGMNSTSKISRNALDNIQSSLWYHRRIDQHRMPMKSIHIRKRWGKVNKNRWLHTSLKFGRHTFRPAHTMIRQIKIETMWKVNTWSMIWW